MLNFPAISMIKLPKLVVHSILLVIGLTFLSLFTADLMSLAFGKSIEASSSLVTLITLSWLFFSIKSPRYKKSN